MQQTNSGLKIHTKTEAPTSQEAPKPKHKFNLKLPVMLTERQPKRHKTGVHSAKKKLSRRLTAMDKLMRNSAVACALLLTVLALQNLNHPWTVNATNQLRQVLTMRIDLDESLGRLNFVRGLVPETALVFWNMGSSARLQAPVAGTVAHEYSQQQPWIEFVCNAQQSVVASETGVVAACMQGSAGDWTLMIDHENGEQTVYAYMAQAFVQAGQTVERGAQIGVTQDQESSRLYFELRKNGTPQDPSKQM